jgi:phosphoglycerol transferase
MPTGAAIFELPIMQFPEVGPQVRMLDYDPYRGYLHDDGSLRWSYGGVKGRPIADWQLIVRNKIGPIAALPALLGVGYDGIWVDTFGYEDGGAQIRADLQKTLRTRPLESEDRRLLFFDLRPYAARLGRSDAQLDAIAQRQLGFNPAKGPPEG